MSRELTKATFDLKKQESRSPEGMERTRERRVFVPRADIHETGDAIHLTADMPGVDEKSLEVTLEKNVLTVAGRVEPEIPEGRTLAFAEYGVGDYERSFVLTDAVDRDGIAASIRDGVLRVTLRKAVAVQARKIPVHAG